MLTIIGLVAAGTGVSLGPGVGQPAGARRRHLPPGERRAALGAGRDHPRRRRLGARARVRGRGGGGLAATPRVALSWPDGPVWQARRSGGASTGAVQRRDRLAVTDRSGDEHRCVLRPWSRRGAGDRPRGLASKGARDGRDRAEPLVGDVARGVSRADRDRHASVRRQPASGAGRDPRHSRGGAVGSWSHRHRDLDGRRTRRRARARGTARRSDRCGVRGGGPVSGGNARRSRSEARFHSTRPGDRRCCSPGP